MTPIRSLARPGIIAALVCFTGLPRFATAAPERSGQVNLGQATKRTLLFFPFDVQGTNVPGAADVSALLSDVARSRLIASDAYTVVQFNRGLGPVARLYNDQQLSDSDIQHPFAEDNAKGIKIAKLVGYEIAFVGSVDDYSYNDADKQATVTVSGRMLDATNGKILKSATLSATSSKGGSAKEPEKALEAARAAGDKLMTQLVPNTSVIREVPPTANMKKTPPHSNGKKRGNNQGLILGLLAVAIGLGIGLAAGGGGGGGGGDLPPARPTP